MGMFVGIWKWNPRAYYYYYYCYDYFIIIFVVIVIVWYRNETVINFNNDDNGEVWNSVLVEVWFYFTNIPIESLITTPIPAPMLCPKVAPSTFILNISASGLFHLLFLIIGLDKVGSRLESRSWNSCWVCLTICWGERVFRQKLDGSFLARYAML